MSEAPKVNIDETLDWAQVLVGKSVTAADMATTTLTLSDGTRLVFQREADDCCSWIELSSLATTKNIITAADVRDDDPGEGEYRAWVHVVTEAGELRIAEAEANASNGYYLHGWALDVEVIPPAAGGGGR